MQKVLRLVFPIVALVLGIIVVISGIIGIRDRKLYDSTAVATVTDIQEHWEDTGEDSHLVTTVYIDYEVNGKEYKHVEAPESDSSIQIGDRVEILYQSKNPEKIEGHHITRKSVIFIIIGFVVAIGGIFGTLKAFFKR